MSRGQILRPQQHHRVMVMFLLEEVEEEVGVWRRVEHRRLLYRQRWTMRVEEVRIVHRFSRVVVAIIQTRFKIMLHMHLIAIIRRILHQLVVTLEGRLPLLIIIQVRWFVV